jgi:hypothetical protein
MCGGETRCRIEVGRWRGLWMSGGGERGRGREMSGSWSRSRGLYRETSYSSSRSRGERKSRTCD